jgi:signal peptidase I
MSDFAGRLVDFTQKWMTRGNAKRRIAKERSKAMNPVLDWVGTLFWAAGMVLLINQYAFQAYTIPSGSMIDTLLIKDRIFVNKFIFGPEILPGFGKINFSRTPQRNEVIIFENPSYISRGAAFDVAQTLLFMLTFSIVNLDKDENGQPKAHHLIKRAVGTGGDTFYNQNGDMLVKFAGENHIVSEKSYNNERGWTHNLSRLMDAGDYEALYAAAKASAWQDLRLESSIPRELVQKAARANSIEYPDYISYEAAWLSELNAALPFDKRYSSRLARHEMGYYVAPGRTMPLGDNRDNSRDGRYFGPVKNTRILGKGALKYWPPGRVGAIK